MWWVLTAMSVYTALRDARHYLMRNCAIAPKSGDFPIAAIAQLIHYQIMQTVDVPNRASDAGPDDRPELDNRDFYERLECVEDELASIRRANWMNKSTRRLEVLEQIDELRAALEVL